MLLGDECICFCAGEKFRISSDDSKRSGSMYYTFRLLGDKCCSFRALESRKFTKNRAPVL